MSFSGQYDGNTDVYIIPIEGGDPKRLTWHPGADIVQGWTPDGKNHLYFSTASLSHSRLKILYSACIRRHTGAHDSSVCLCRKPEGQRAVEGTGVTPDIEVLQDPKAIIEGNDPQLERAVQEALQLLKTEGIELKKEPAAP